MVLTSVHGTSHRRLNCLDFGSPWGKLHFLWLGADHLARPGLGCGEAGIGAGRPGPGLIPLQAVSPCPPTRQGPLGPRPGPSTAPSSAHLCVGHPPSGWSLGPACPPLCRVYSASQRWPLHSPLSWSHVHEWPVFGLPGPGLWAVLIYPGGGLSRHARLPRPGWPALLWCYLYQGFQMGSLPTV